MACSSLFAFVALCWVLGMGGVAHAQNFNVKLYDPVANPYAILGQHTSRGSGHFFLYGQLSTNYANDLLIGVYNNQITTRPIAHRLTSEFALGFGMWNRLDVALSLPVHWGQWRADFPNPGDDNMVTGLGDMRLHVKGTILENKKFGGFGLAAVLEVGVPLGPEDELMRSPSVYFAPRLVLDYRWKDNLAITLNVAYRLQDKATLRDIVVDDELRLGLGVEIPLFFEGTTVLGELASLVNFGETNAQTVSPAQLTLPLEAMVGVRWRHRSGFQVSFGTGMGLTTGLGAPDFRFFVNLGYGRGLFEKPKKDPAKDPMLATRRTPPVRRDVKPPARRDVKPDTQRVAVKDATPPPFKKEKPISPSNFDKAAAADPDPDGDGIPGAKDRCPNQAEDFDSFKDDDGCPDLDNDRDGIPDKVDKCPLKPETINGIKDDDGCPDKGQGRVLLTKGSIKILDRVFFDSGSDRLKPKSFGILDQVAGVIRANWQIRLILVEGHTDSQGNREMNVDLSERRARRVMAYLVQKGVAQTRLTAKGYGPKKPIMSNKTRKGRAKNRRVEFKILKVFVPKRSQRSAGGAK
tara:strand:+ start:10574 stop:12304 length:1731 start_codon:yes stop_codon:yes gene_type:complete